MTYGKRFFPRWNILLKKSRPTLADGDQPSTRGQFGGGGSSDSCDILTNPYTFEREIQGPLRKIGSATLHSKLN